MYISPFIYESIPNKLWGNTAFTETSEATSPTKYQEQQLQFKKNSQYNTP
jgi:hypothetical protein